MRASWLKPDSPSRRESGFSLLELMIAMAIGLLIVALLITVYVRSASTNAEFQRTNSQMENGRFALQLMQQELMHAGFWGEYVPPTAAPSAAVNPCLAWASWTAAEKSNVFKLPVQGYNADKNGGTNTGPTLPTECNTPLANAVTGSDVLVARHAETCLAGTGDCENYATNKLYLQVSLCAGQNNTDTTQPNAEYEFGRENDGATFTRQIRTCTDPAATNPATALRAGKRKFVSYIYYIRNPGDGPVLARSKFDVESGDVIARTAETLVENIENLQVEYLLDDGSRAGTTAGDGTADSDWITCSSCTAAQWNNVMAVRLHLLARSSSATPGYTDTKTYAMGTGAIAGPYNDGFKRHVYSLVAYLVNPANRRLAPGS